jgi:two-component system sensor histidine kinase QseC
MNLPRSLQGRLLVLVLALVIGAWLATAGLIWVDARHELDELLDSHLAQAAALLVVQAGDIDDDHRVDAPKLHRYAPKVAFQVFRKGRLALRSSNAGAEPMLALAARAPDVFRTIDIGGTAWRVFATHGRERDVQVFVGEQVASRSSILRAVLRSSLAPMLFALPLLALAAWLAVRRGVAPLRLVGRTLAERSPDELQPVAVANAPSEMAPMLDALNGLFARIAALLDSERRFTADAAHELRTPIAVIRAHAQVALGATSDSERAHALHATLQGCDRATRVVEQLLTLSRIESDSEHALVAVDLAALTRQVAADFAPSALAKRQVLVVEANAPCTVQGDATLLSVLIRNLVDNAIRYAGSGATVKVAVAEEQGVVRLAVDDSGPGVSPADAERFGERFFRVVGSGQDGSGLGWSIVRRIAGLHRAAVRVGKSQSLGGLSAEVRFPIDSGRASTALA